MFFFNYNTTKDTPENRIIILCCVILLRLGRRSRPTAYAERNESVATLAFVMMVRESLRHKAEQFSQRGHNAASRVCNSQHIGSPTRRGIARVRERQRDRASENERAPGACTRPRCVLGRGNQPACALSGLRPHFQAPLVFTRCRSLMAFTFTRSHS